MTIRSKGSLEHWSLNARMFRDHWSGGTPQEKNFFVLYGKSYFSRRGVINTKILANTKFYVNNVLDIGHLKLPYI